MTKSICLVFGEGGHAEQGRRLGRILQPYSYDIYQISDVNDLIFPGIKIGHIRDKSKGLPIGPVKTIKAIFSVILFLREKKVDRVISLGPGVGIIAALCCVILRIKFIHIESWSRFSDLSLTSKILLKMRFSVWVQNEDLIKSKRFKNLQLIGRL